MYSVYAVFDSSYAFTGNARQASFGVEADAALECHALSFALADEVQFKGGEFRIVRARLLASGAIGLAPGKEKIAGNVKLKFVTGGEDASGSFDLSFVKWDEWVDQDLCIGVTDSAVGKDCELAVIKSGTTFTCDDFNIDAAYSGETVVPMLELEIDAKRDSVTRRMSHGYIQNKFDI